MCLDDSPVNKYAYGDTNRPAGIRAWITDGGVFKRCKFLGMTEDAPDVGDPCSVPFSGGATTACDDLTIADFSDDFDDNSLHCRYVESGVGDAVETNQELQVTATHNDGAYSSKILTVSFDDHSGDFKVQIDFELQAWGGSFNANGTRGASIAVRSPEDAFVASMSNYYYRSGTGSVQHYWAGDVGVAGNSVTGAPDSGSMRIRRESGTIYIDYDAGVGWTNLYSDDLATDIGKITITTMAARITVDQRVDFDNLEVFTYGMGSSSSSSSGSTSGSSSPSSSQSASPSSSSSSSSSNSSSSSSSTSLSFSSSSESLSFSSSNSSSSSSSESFSLSSSSSSSSLGG